MLFGRHRQGGAGPSADAEARAAESLRAVEAGALPLAAQERMSRIAADGSSAYSSDLSTAEFLLLRQAGFRPLTQVMGTCFYNVGWQSMPMGYGPTSGQIFELDAPTQAWQEARRRALVRLRAEAQLVGADAVVGVRIARGHYEWAGHMLEFIAVGTAVKCDRLELGEDKPVLSNLSGEDFIKLYARGYWPVGVVAGTTVMYVMTGWQQQMSSGFMSFANQELNDFTRGLQAARRTAMQRVHAEASGLSPAGLVGMRFELETHEHERSTGNDSEVTDLIVTVHALGTAIVELAAPGTTTKPVTVALTLNEEPS